MADRPNHLYTLVKSLEERPNIATAFWVGAQPACPSATPTPPKGEIVTFLGALRLRAGSSGEGDLRPVIQEWIDNPNLALAAWTGVQPTPDPSIAGWLDSLPDPGALTAFMSSLLTQAETYEAEATAYAQQSRSRARD